MEPHHVGKFEPRSDNVFADVNDEVHVAGYQRYLK